MKPNSPKFIKTTIQSDASKKNKLFKAESKTG